MADKIKFHLLDEATELLNYFSTKIEAKVEKSTEEDLKRMEMVARRKAIGTYVEPEPTAWQAFKESMGAYGKATKGFLKVPKIQDLKKNWATLLKKLKKQGEQPYGTYPIRYE